MCQMETELGEHDDITRLLRGAFVRICQLAISNSGVSVAELTIYVSVQLNTGVPQIFSTTLAETVRSPLAKGSHHTQCTAMSPPAKDSHHAECTAMSPPAKDSHHAECLASSTTETLNKAQSVDNADSCGDMKEEALESCDRSFDSEVDASNVGSLTSTNMYRTSTTESQLPSSDLNGVNNVVLSEDSRNDVLLEELLADAGKLRKCNNRYASERPEPALLDNDVQSTDEVVENVDEGGRQLLLYVGSAEHSKVPANDPCILSVLQSSCDSDMLSHCAGDTVHDSAVPCHSGCSSFLHDCHFIDDGSTCSNSACIPVESPFNGLMCEFVEKPSVVDEVPDVEGKGLLTSPCGKTGDRFAGEHRDTSHEEVVVVDESGLCSKVGPCHAVATQSSRLSSHSSLSVPVTRQQPVSSETSTQRGSVLKLYPAKHLTSTLCPDASDSSYPRQTNALTFTTGGYGVIKTNGDNSDSDAWDVKFTQKLLPQSPELGSVAYADRGKCPYCLLSYFSSHIMPEISYHCIYLYCVEYKHMYCR